jgi:hypothetical protein
MIAKLKNVVEGQNRIILYPTRARFLLVAFGSLIFVFLGSTIRSWSDQVPVPSWFTAIASYLAMGFFGLCFVYAVYRLVVRKPSLILSREGILDNASAVSAGFVRWEEVDRIFYSSMMNQEFVSIALKDTEGFLGRIGGVKATLMRANVGLVGAPINLPANALAVSSAELLKLIQDFRKAQNA